jgi:hypothetical protein
LNGINNQTPHNSDSNIPETSPDTSPSISRTNSTDDTGPPTPGTGPLPGIDEENDLDKSQHPKREEEVVAEVVRDRPSVSGVSESTQGSSSNKESMGVQGSSSDSSIHADSNTTPVKSSLETAKTSLVTAIPATLVTTTYDVVADVSRYIFIYVYIYIYLDTYTFKCAYTYLEL